MSKTMKEQLGSIFVNTCGEICNNLATTKSEVGPVKRKSVDKNKTNREEMGKARKKLMELRGKEREMEQRIKALRSEGLQQGAGSEMCVKFFAEANDVNNELRGLRKNIRKLSKKVYK